MRPSGISHNHRKITVFHALERNVQVAAALQGHIVLAVLGRLSVPVGIDSESGEVAGVPGPHPVVRLASELAHTCGRGAYEADVAIYLIHNQIEHIVVVEVDRAHAASGVLLPGLVEGFLDGCFVAHLVGDVAHALEKLHAQARHPQLLALVCRPEAVFKVVVLGGGESLDG